MRSKKDSRQIVVDDVEYRWRATGSDGHIEVNIWPANNIGPLINGSLGYHQTWVPSEDRSHLLGVNQIVVTNRIVRRIIDYAISMTGYDPLVNGKQLNLKALDSVIKWDDAVRAPGHTPLDGAS